MVGRVRAWATGAWLSILDGLYVVAAIGCFGLTIFSIWLDRAASAAVAATLAVAFLLLRHLPIIESFKAFNMEAKFARRVPFGFRLSANTEAVGFIASNKFRGTMHIEYLITFDPIPPIVKAALIQALGSWPSEARAEGGGVFEVELLIT